MDLGLVNMMLYNSNIKISGNVITLKTYENTQGYGYITERVIGSHRRNISEYDIERIKKENFLKSSRRAKTKIFDLVACNVNKHKDHEGKKQTVKFLTLTFKDSYKDIEKANLEITKFLKRLSYNLYKINKNVIKYISVPELQKRGVWHYHIILFNCKYVPFTSLLNIWGLGGVYINALKSGLDGTTIAKYVTKYISKGITVKEGFKHSIIEQEGNQGDDRLTDYNNYKKNGLENKKRYQTSRGLIQPYIRKLKIDRIEWAVITNYIIENAKVDQEGKKEVYFNSINNEYRGEINILVATVTDKEVKQLQSQIELIHKVNRKENTVSYKPKWAVIKDKLFNNQWKERRKEDYKLKEIKKKIENYRGV